MLNFRRREVEHTVVIDSVHAPHCDSSILHAPSMCQYCDMFPLWQMYRQVARIAFTGTPGDAYMSPCPSTWFRDPGSRDLWFGNVAVVAYGPAFVIQEEP